MEGIGDETELSDAVCIREKVDWIGLGWVGSGRFEMISLEVKLKTE